MHVKELGACDVYPSRASSLCFIVVADGTGVVPNMCASTSTSTSTSISPSLHRPPVTHPHSSLFLSRPLWTFLLLARFIFRNVDMHTDFTHVGVFVVVVVVFFNVAWPAMPAHMTLQAGKTYRLGFLWWCAMIVSMFVWNGFLACLP